MNVVNAHIFIVEELSIINVYIMIEIQVTNADAYVYIYACYYFKADDNLQVVQISY